MKKWTSVYRPFGEYLQFFEDNGTSQRHDCRTELVLRGLLGDTRWRKDLSAHWRKAMTSKRVRTDGPGGLLQCKDDEGR